MEIPQKPKSDEPAGIEFDAGIVVYQAHQKLGGCPLENLDVGMIRRDAYVEKLLRLMGNGNVKVVTGIRRCGKSYLLDKTLLEK